MLAEVVCDLFGGGHGSEREAISLLFCHGDDVGLNSDHVTAPIVRANSSETSLDLVTEVKATSFFDMGNSLRNIILGQWNQAADSLNGLSHEECDLTGCVESDSIFNILRVEVSCIRFTLPWSSVKVWESGRFYTLSPWDIVVPTTD